MLCNTHKPIILIATVLLALSVQPAAAQTTTEDFEFNYFSTQSGSGFGRAVGFSGTTIIVGASTEDFMGAAYVFDANTRGLIAKLTEPNPGIGNQFGRTVAISGTTAIVGAPGSNPGSAYLFDTTDGHLIAELIESGPSAGNSYGESVAIWGATAIVGAPDDGSGSAYLFDTTSGLQIAELIASDAADSDLFGWSVAVSGSIAIVGAPLVDGAVDNMGAAYLFDTATGAQVAKFTPPSDVNASHFFGTSVAISGTTAIIGAYGDNHAGNESGSAYLIDMTSGELIVKITAPSANSDDQFGIQVAVSDTIAVFGVERHDHAGNNSGLAYVFDTTSGELLTTLTASNVSAGDSFGFSTAVSGANVIVGANGTDLGSISSNGSAFLFHLGPAIDEQPQGLISIAGQTAELSVQLEDETDVSYQWKRNGVDLVDSGNISGTQTSTLQIVAATEDDIDFYSCISTNGFGPIESDTVLLAVKPDPNACLPDLNNDGVLDFFDVSAFLQAFGAGCP